MNSICMKRLPHWIVPTPSTDAYAENAMCRILVLAILLDVDRLACGLSIFLCLDLIDSFT